MADLGGMFYRSLLFPMLDLRRGTNSLKCLAELQKSQWLSKDEILNIQNKRLRALIKHSYENVPYYHKTFKKLGIMPEDIKNKEDLVKLPIIDKTIIKNNFEDFKAKNFENWKPISRTTGGTTGKPFRYFSDSREHSVFWADLWRVWGWAGWEIGEKRATIGGSAPSSSGFKFRSFISSRVMERNLSLSSFEVKTEAMQDHLDKLKRFKPKILRGYPSALYLFAKFIDERKITGPKISSIVSISEQLYEHQRKAIENVFECKVFDNYGCPDGGILVCECEEHEYHINSENAIAEIVKKEDVVSAGEKGEIVSTNLARFAMPFIRYRTGDVGKAKDDKSNCKRGLEMFDSILGRTSDYLILPSGDVLSGVSIAAVFNKISSQINIKHYQVVQEKKGELKVLLVADEGYSDKDSELIFGALQEHMGNKMSIEIKEVDDIPLTESGKRRSVVSKLEVELT